MGRSVHSTDSKGGALRAIGVDVGGTLTNLALWDDARGALAVFKLPSVPQDPAVDNFIQGLTATGTS